MIFKFFRNFYHFFYKRIILYPTNLKPTEDSNGYDQKI